MRDKRTRYEFRRRRSREKLSSSQGRPRLSVHRSNRHLYAQVVDDLKGETLAYASSLSKELRGKAGSGKGMASAALLGSLIAQRAIQKGVKQVRFDRGGRIFHGRIKAVAEAARAAGLEF